MNAWLVVLGVGAGSYVMRAAFVIALGGRPTPRWVTRVSRFVLPTAFAALVAGAVRGAPEIVALGVAGVVAFRTRSTVTALVAGLPAFWIAQGFLR
jgi:branched-subunit amino acid transport protein